MARKSHKKVNINIPICNLCNQQSTLVTGEDIYPHRKDLFYKKFYQCQQHKDMYVGCHDNTQVPLGILTNKEHRQLKMKCHSIFDPLWRNKGTRNTRFRLYRKLSHAMKLHISETHFGMFTQQQLNQAYEIISNWINNGEEKQ
jgi:hypothetical protein